MDTSPPPTDRRQPLLARLFAPIDIASLIVFRIAFGAILTWEAVRYLLPRKPDGLSWARLFYIEPEFLFKYHGFGWIHPWPGDGMIVHFLAWVLAAACVTIGFCYRAAAIVLCVLIGHMFLLDQTRYLNHMYFIWLLSFLIIFLPLNRAASVDAWRRSRTRAGVPSRRSAPNPDDTAPAWTLWLLRFQVGVVYFFSGVARSSGDWVRGEPMRMWLRDRAEASLFAPFLAGDLAPYLFSIGGMLFDLLIVPLLLWRRTRMIAFCLAVGFHLANAYIFHIGVFPWLGIAATTLFFEPGWARSVPARLKSLGGTWARVSLDAPAARLSSPKSEAGSPTQASAPLVVRRGLVTAMALYVAVQLLMPLRHLLYPGDVNWTHEGHYFSWRMKLDDRRGKMRFHVIDPATGTRHDVDVDRFLTPRQKYAMAARPHMTVQFARHVSREYRKEFRAGEDPPVHATVEMSLNGRPMKPLIDPAINLASRTISLRPADWIVRQELEPLAPPSHRADARRLRQ